MRNWLLSLAALALIASPALAGKYNKAVSVGDKAPQFDAIPAIAGDKETSVSLGDVKDDVVVVVFLANHCPVVKLYDDRIIDLVNNYKGKSVKVIGLSVTAAPGQKSVDDLPAIKSKVKEDGLNYTYGYDESQKVGKAYGAVATPQFFVLDKTRTIRYMGALDDNNDTGKVKKNYVKTAIDNLLANETVEVTETRARGCGIGYQK